MKKYKIIGQALWQIYKDLNKAYTKYIEHQINFYINFN